jgi:hypothetical protein
MFVTAQSTPRGRGASRPAGYRQPSLGIAITERSCAISKRTCGGATGATVYRRHRAWQSGCPAMLRATICTGPAPRGALRLCTSERKQKKPPEGGSCPTYCLTAGRGLFIYIFLPALWLLLSDEGFAALSPPLLCSVAFGCCCCGLAFPGCCPWGFAMISSSRMPGFRTCGCRLLQPSHYYADLGELCRCADALRGSGEP